MSSNVTVNIFWWEGVAIFFTIITMLSLAIKPKGNLTKEKRRKMDSLYTLLPSMPAMAFGLYGLFNNKNGAIPCLFALIMTVFAVFMKNTKYWGDSGNIIKKR